jgi:hypothetical protein
MDSLWRPGTALMEELITRFRITPWYEEGEVRLWASIEAWVEEDWERLLDIIHVVIQQKDLYTRFERLDEILSLGGSVYTATERGIEVRTDPTAKQAFEIAMQPRDSASDELAEAWANAYGRDPDPSDAWDHAIKAVEAILRGIVSPNNTQATLGTLIRDIRNGVHKFQFVLTDDLGGVNTFLAMLQLMWPNPDRHGDLQQRHTPSIDEARAVVQLAVTIVQWARDGQIVRR